MTRLCKIKVWKKGTDRYTSMPDYQIEIEDGDTYKLTGLIEAITILAEEMVGKGEKEDE